MSIAALPEHRRGSNGLAAIREARRRHRCGMPEDYGYHPALNTEATENDMRYSEILEAAKIIRQQQATSGVRSQSTVQESSEVTPEVPAQSLLSKAEPSDAFGCTLSNGLV